MARNEVQYIDGEWRSGRSDETVATQNPANPSEVVLAAPGAAVADVEDAMAAAVDASESWAGTTPDERAAILHRVADRIDEEIESIAETLTREEGKPISSARAEVARTVDIFHYFAEDARRATGTTVPSNDTETFTYTVREPLGVVSIITPWNFPVAAPGWKLAPALATGNTVVFKPSSVTPLVAVRLVEAITAAGVPEGVVNLIIGSGSTVGDELVEHQAVSGVSFTGSNGVGERIGSLAGQRGIPVQTEMGGKNPQVVMPDADLEAAVDAAVAGAYGGTGQACTATSRILVHEAVREAFTDQLLAAVEALTIGPGMEDPDVGPAASSDQHETNRRYVDVGDSEGATLLTGGSKPETSEEGYYLEPAVFDDVTPDMRIAQEEIFGPVLSLMPVEDYQDAVSVANSVRFGLSASIFTSDMNTARRFVSDIEAGVVKVNNTTTGSDIQMPFGGMKASSAETHKELGQRAYSFYTHEKAVYRTDY